MLTLQRYEQSEPILMPGPVTDIEPVCPACGGWCCWDGERCHDADCGYSDRDDLGALVELEPDPAARQAFSAWLEQAEEALFNFWPVEFEVVA